MIHRKYGTIEFDQDLVSGFLTALKNFSIEFSMGSGNLKVIDMQIFYLMLVFKEGVLITAVADKNDDSKITHKVLTDIIDKFVAKYGDKIKTWEGDIRVFKDFDKTIDQILKNGKIAEVKLMLPILKIYKKDFEKSQAKLAKKGLILSEEDLRKVRNKTPEWTEKRLPRQVITQGFLNEKQYEVAHLADGFHTIDNIAEEVGIPKEEVQVIVNSLDSLGLLQFIEIRQD